MTTPNIPAWLDTTDLAPTADREESYSESPLAPELFDFSSTVASHGYSRPPTPTVEVKPVWRWSRIALAGDQVSSSGDEQSQTVANQQTAELLATEQWLVETDPCCTAENERAARRPRKRDR